MIVSILLCNVVKGTRGEIVNGNDVVAPGQKIVTDVRAEETRSPGNHNSHLRPIQENVNPSRISSSKSR